jgi:hypothetical protein
LAITGNAMSANATAVIRIFFICLLSIGTSVGGGGR